MSEEREQGGSIMKLTRANYHAWLSQVKDLILSLDHDNAADIWQEFETWDPSSPVINPGRDGEGKVVEDYDYQAAANSSDKILSFATCITKYTVTSAAPSTRTNSRPLCISQRMCPNCCAISATGGTKTLSTTAWNSLRSTKPCV